MEQQQPTFNAACTPNPVRAPANKIMLSNSVQARHLAIEVGLSCSVGFHASQMPSRPVCSSRSRPSESVGAIFRRLTSRTSPQSTFSRPL
eukprot:6187207-Pleurochrysis_carterae.AAC.1